MTGSRLGRGIWAAWGLAFVGGLAVLVATVLMISDPCVEAGERVLTAACATAASTSTTVASLALTGTAVAVIGGLSATALTVRRLTRRPDREVTGLEGS